MQIVSPLKILLGVSLILNLANNIEIITRRRISMFEL